MAWTNQVYKLKSSQQIGIQNVRNSQTKTYLLIPTLQCRDQNLPEPEAWLCRSCRTPCQWGYSCPSADTCSGLEILWARPNCLRRQCSRGERGGGKCTGPKRETWESGREKSKGNRKTGKGMVKGYWAKLCPTLSLSLSHSCIIL